MIVHLKRVAGVRRVEEIAVLEREEGGLRARPAWTYTVGRAPAASSLASLVNARGVPVPAVLL